MIPKPITITGVLTLPDDEPTAGTVQFKNSVVVVHATQDALMLPDTIDVVVGADGMFSVQVPSSNDPAWSPSGYSWEVTVKTTGRPAVRWSILVPYNAPGDTISLGELAPIPSANGQLYALVGHTHADYVTDAELVTALAPFIDATEAQALATDLELSAGLAGLQFTVNAGYDLANATSIAMPVRPSDHGFAGWMFDPSMVQAGTVLATAGLSYVFRFKATGSLITNINLHFTSGGTGLTAGQCFASLHNDAGAQLGITADQATNWVGGGYKTCPLTAPVAVTPGAWYKVRVWFNGTTGPTLSRGVNSASAIVNAGLVAPNFRWSTADAGLTTAALAPANIGAMTGAATAWWLAVS